MYTGHNIFYLKFVLGMAARLREYSNEELNYFRICHVSTSILPKALRTVFKHEWDIRYKASLG